MPTGGRLATRALEAWIGLLELLGARGTRWEWRKRAWLQALETRLAAWENVERSVRTTTRMCRSCRSLVEGGASLCPACGASMRGVPRGGASRALRLIAPGSPSVSVLLLTANVALSIAALAVGGVAPPSGLLAILSPTWDALLNLGANLGALTFAAEPWRLVTANYLHGGLIHLVFNSFALMSLGPLIEESFGARRLFVIYTLSGIAGFIASGLSHPGTLSIGASGAIFGLLGFAIVFGRFRAGAAGRAIAAQLGRWLLFAVMMFFIPGIDSAAHIGGLIPGALLGLVLDPGEPRTPALNLALSVLALLALALTLGSFGMVALTYGQALAAIQGR